MEDEVTSPLRKRAARVPVEDDLGFIGTIPVRYAKDKGAEPQSRDPPLAPSLDPTPPQLTSSLSSPPSTQGVGGRNASESVFRALPLPQAGGAAPFTAAAAATASGGRRNGTGGQRRAGSVSRGPLAVMVRKLRMNFLTFSYCCRLGSSRCDSPFASPSLLSPP
jgi:hypothetical protein